MTNLVGKTTARVAAGWEHSLLLANDGTVFSFGANYTGQTGLGTIRDFTLIATPIDTTNLIGLHVTDIDAGFEHNILIAVPESDSILLLALGSIAIAAQLRIA